MVAPKGLSLRSGGLPPGNGGAKSPPFEHPTSRNLELWVAKDQETRRTHGIYRGAETWWEGASMNQAKKGLHTTHFVFGRIN